MAQGITVIDAALLDQVSAAARRSPRLRKNHNLHPCDRSACHRLFNAIEPGSYVQPHRHLDPEKDETLIMTRGSMGVVTFDEGGAVTGTVRLQAGGEPLGADIPHGVYHSVVSLEPGTIFFEAKSGPYLPFSAGEKAPFAPEEGDPAAPAYLERLQGLFP